MKADPDAQRRLLDLQAIDTALTQLNHRRRTLPEHAELERLTRAVAAGDDARVRAQVGVDDLDRDISRLEKDIEQVRSRTEKDQGRLDAGSGPARELEALQHEIVSLARRKSELEDTELELMEKREAAQAVLDEAIRAVAEQRDQITAAEQRRESALTEITQEEQTRQAERGPAASALPADLVALYERIRETSGGIGAAPLRHGRCEGCRLELSGGVRAALRAADPDEVVRCEECRRILVRTAESGL